jgi:hypothetical protein
VAAFPVDHGHLWFLAWRTSFDFDIAREVMFWIVSDGN